MKWVTNHLQIKGDKSLEVLQSLLTKTTEYVQDEPEEWTGIDFNKIRPMPDSLKEAAVPNTVQENWCLENWGVRGNAFDTQIPDEAKAEVFFETADNAVESLIKDLSAAHCEFINGKNILQEQYSAGSKEGYEMYFKLWGNKDLFVFNEQKNTYERAEMEMG